MGRPAPGSVPIEDIVRGEYRNYQIYTLMDRAIPYLQDGLKPGQRRILFTLYKNQSKGLIKVTAATGLVLTLHPHGPPSIESTIVNLAQDYTFSNNYPLLEKKGYFGERMETAPAAGRYIECRLGGLARYLLFDDMNQVEMAPNYDETVEEPVALLPKLPIMLLNGAEGIGTGFSSVIPSFHHADICDSLIRFVETGRTKRLKPFVRHYTAPIGVEKGHFVFPMVVEQKKDKIVITELPRNYDAAKIYRLLARLIEQDVIKDFIDSSVGNDVHIELVFKKGRRPSLGEARERIHASTSLTPNYTLISERGVRIFKRPEEILEIFAGQRIGVVRRRHELKARDLKERIRRNKEVVRFIKEKEYEAAVKARDRKAFVLHLAKRKYAFGERLADMPIHRMTRDEVRRLEAAVKEDGAAMVAHRRIAGSDALVRGKVVEELREVRGKLDEWLRAPSPRAGAGKKAPARKSKARGARRAPAKKAKARGRRA